MRVIKLRHEETTMELVAKHIWDELGPGYSERVYHNAFEVALRKRGLKYETERILPISYEGHNIGNLRSDLIIEGNLIVELKSTSRLTDQFRNQIRNYMKLTGIFEGMLINFPDKGGNLEYEYVSRLS